MRKRSLWIAAILVCVVTPLSLAAATEFHAQLFPITGEVRLANKGSLPVTFVYYSITSAANALNGSSAAWKSISDFYDASGNGFIDPSTEWIKLSSSSSALTEAVFGGPGGSLPAMQVVSLGTIWNPYAALHPDLLFDIRQPDEQMVNVTIELAIDGDYSGDGVVDAVDYLLWRRYFGTNTYFADGNLNGVVDEADYDLWRENFGRTVPLPPYVAGSAVASTFAHARWSAIPEPTTASLMLAALAAWIIARAGVLRAVPCAARRRAVRP